MLLYNEDILDMVHQGFRDTVVKQFLLGEVPPTKCNIYRAYDLDEYDAIQELNGFLRDIQSAN
jgi:hypothetical protein